jgi:transposase InsO family protein
VILETVEQAQARSGQPLQEILPDLELPRATYYRWQERAAEGRLDDQVVVPRRQVLLPTPAEVTAVRSFALDHPAAGYKRLTWMMVDEDVAYLRPYQVYRILVAQNLLFRRPAPATEALRRPPAPDHPDQAWHIDLMYLRVGPRWYYLVDIVDGYSRYLVHWSLNLTMLTDTVTLTVQEALDGLPERRPGEPQLVHDHGSQFISGEWRRFVEGAGVTDIFTRAAHPQSNGVVERLHRTHREEGLDDEALADYYRALGAMAGWSDYYNHARPHSALGYLWPVDYYRGDPAARLTERQQKLVQAVEARKAYWEEYGC